MKYVSPEYEQTLTSLAETLITPQRYGRVAIDAYSGDIPFENLGGLFDVES